MQEFLFLLTIIAAKMIRIRARLQNITEEIEITRKNISYLHVRKSLFQPFQ